MLVRTRSNCGRPIRSSLLEDAHQQPALRVTLDRSIGGCAPNSLFRSHTLGGANGGSGSDMGDMGGALRRQ